MMVYGLGWTEPVLMDGSGYRPSISVGGGGLGVVWGHRRLGLGALKGARAQDRSQWGQGSSELQDPLGPTPCCSRSLASCGCQIVQGVTTSQPPMSAQARPW